MTSTKASAPKKSSQKPTAKTVKVAPAAKPAAEKQSAPRAVRGTARTKKVAVGAAAMSSACVACQSVAPEDKAFWVNNGPVVSTLEGLCAAMEAMSDEQFDYHTKRAGNDFARWVDEVLCHGACAKKLAAAKTRSGAVRAIAVCQC